MLALDTNIIVDLLRGRDQFLADRFLCLPPASFAVPEMVRAELFYGALRSSRPEENRAIVERFLAPIRPLPFDTNAAAHYAQIRLHLERSGTAIGANDLVIAATARASRCVLITRNTKEFQRIPALAVEEW